MTDKTKSSIWMLFASGASVEVHANSYEAPAGSKRPVNAYVVSDCDGDCEEAAARAVETVWQAVSVQGKRMKPMVYGFDLPGRKAKKPVVGASGGLAFVVSAMQNFTGCEFGPVAATGILQSTDLDAPILEVRSIAEKLEAAQQLVPSGGLVLYPESNDYEVTASLKSRFREKKIRLRSVRDVSHVLEILMEDLPGGGVQSQNGLPKWILMAACGLLTALLVTAGVYYTFDKKSPTTLQAEQHLEESVKKASQETDTEGPVVVPAVESSTVAASSLGKGVSVEGGEVTEMGTDDGAPDSEDIDPEKLAEFPKPEQPAKQLEQYIESSIQPSKGFD